MYCNEIENNNQVNIVKKHTFFVIFFIRSFAENAAVGDMGMPVYCVFAKSMMAVAVTGS